MLILQGGSHIVSTSGVLILLFTGILMYLVKGHIGLHIYIIFKEYLLNDTGYSWNVFYMFLYTWLEEQNLGTCYITCCLEFRWSEKSWCFGLRYRRKRKRKKLCYSRSDQVCRTWSQKAVARYGIAHWHQFSRRNNKVTRHVATMADTISGHSLHVQNYEITPVLCGLLTYILPRIQFVWLPMSNFNGFSIHSICWPSKILWLNFDLFTVQVSVKRVTSWEKRYQQVWRRLSVMAHFVSELCDLLTLVNICHGNVYTNLNFLQHSIFLCECM